MVKVQHIKKIYNNGVEALKDINFLVERGEFVSVIGPSGAGKTSLIRMMTGAMKPTSGDIWLQLENTPNCAPNCASNRTPHHTLNDGICAINQLKGKKKRQQQRMISTIYQDFCLVDQLSCLQNVLNADLAEMNVINAMTGHFSTDQKERALQALCAVGLQDKSDIKASQISGGQKQRVAIARAIMQRSKLLLADEPVASLDPYTAEQILDLIQKLQREYGLTVIMNSHNVEAALKYSDRMIGIRDGIVVLDQNAADVRKADLDLVYGAQESLKEGSYGTE